MKKLLIALTALVAASTVAHIQPVTRLSAQAQPRRRTRTSRMIPFDSVPNPLRNTLKKPNEMKPQLLIAAKDLRADRQCRRVTPAGELLERIDVLAVTTAARERNAALLQRLRAACRLADAVVVT